MKRSLLSLLLLTTAATAQIGPQGSRGLASVMAAGLSIDDATRGNGVAEYLGDKKPLNQSTPPGAWNPASFPNMADYSLDAMFGDVAGVDLASGIEIDAHSIGSDVLPAIDDLTGQPQFSSSWLGIIASFSNNAAGTPGSFLAERNGIVTPGIRNKPGADLIGYYFAQSQGINNRLRGKTILEQTSEALGFPGSGLQDVDALDFGLGVQSHAQTVSSLVVFPTTDWFYFSLDPACVPWVNQKVGPLFATNNNNSVSADACAIYRISWNASAGRWSPIEVFKTGAELGLNPSNSSHNLDALAVKHPVGPILFSTHVQNAPTLKWSQIRAHTASGANVDLKEGTDLATKKLGGVDWDDDIDALCGIDPEAGVLDRVFGIATDAVDLGTHEPLSLSMTRAVIASKDSIVLQLNDLDKMAGLNYVLAFTTDMDPNPQQPNGPMRWFDSSLTWTPLAEGQLVPEDAGVLEWTFEIPTGFQASNCGVAVFTRNDSGTYVGGSWVTQFHIY